MKWFDSDYDYIDEFTTQWNERYKKIKRMSIILSIVLFFIGVLCFVFFVMLFLLVFYVLCFQKRYSQRFKLSQPLA